jgi:putative ABC transport system permease protein
MLSRIAFRNIFRNRRRSGITLSVVVFGVVGLILFGGYKAITFRNLRESTIRNRLGHLQVFQAGYEKHESQKPLEYGIDDVAGVRRVIERDPRVSMSAAQISLMGLLSNGDKSVTFLATAVEPKKDEAMSAQRLVGGSMIKDGEPDAVMLGRGLAQSLKAKPGDYLTMMTTTAGGGLNAMDVRVAGIFITGVQEYDDRAVKMPIAGAQNLLQTKKVERLLVFLHETEQTDAAEAAIGAALKASGFAVEIKDWSKLATFYHQVVMLYNGIFGFLGLVVFAIVILSVANTMMMSIFERTREIGTLMAMGTTRSRVWRLFLLEGFFVGVVGALAGVAAGYGLSELINHAHIMLPPPPGYTEGYRLTLQPTLAILASGMFVALVTSTLSAIVPAFRASRMKIVDALGHI